jgi:spore coat protein H
MRRVILLQSLLVLCVISSWSCTRSSPETSAQAPVLELSPPSEDIFDQDRVFSIEIEIPRAGMNALRRTQWGDGEERPSAKATVREGGRVHQQVGIHLKGAAGSFRSVDDKPAMTLKFDKFIKDQRFHGIRKISLNNSVQDPSFLSEKICRELLLAAGVPVPRAGHALVKLNGRELGLYVMLEGANKQFLKRHFGNANGNLDDGGFVRDLHESLPVNSGENPRDRSGLTALIAGLQDCRRQRSLQPLEEVLDVDRFLSMIAMEVMLCHWDGYALNKNNWRVFHDLDARKMVFIPHGLDQTFGAGGQQRDVSSLSSIRWEGELASAVMRTVEGRRRFRDRVGQLYTNVFQTDKILHRLNEMEAGIQSALAQADPGAARRQEHQAKWFAQRINRRTEELRRQLASADAISTLAFGSDGVARLKDWQPSPSRVGTPTLTRSTGARGQSLLGISAGGELATGSWRSRVLLNAGHYRFEGRLRLRDVQVDPADSRAGAGLRISKGTMPAKLAGTLEWTPFSYEFELDDAAADVELICELRALRGEVWFDRDSLRLIRAP